MSYKNQDSTLEAELAAEVDRLTSILDIARREEHEFQQGYEIARRRRQRVEKTIEHLTGEAAPGKGKKKPSQAPTVSDELLKVVLDYVDSSAEPLTVLEISEGTGYHDSSTRNALAILRENEQVRKAG